MAIAEYVEQLQFAENQAQMLKIQLGIVKSKSRAKVYGQHNRYTDITSQIVDDKVDAVQSNHPGGLAQSS